MPTTISLPLALNEVVIERLYTSDPRTGARIPDADLAAAAAAMREARIAAEQAGRLADAVRHDPTRTPAANVVELARTVPPIAERATRALDGATSRLRRTMSELETQMAPPPPSTPEALAVAGEVRSTLARAKDTARADLLHTAVQEGDAAVIGAVLRAPAVVSGITPAAQRELRRRWNGLHHPEAASRTARLDKALSGLEHAAGGLINFTRAVTAPPGASEFLAAAGAAEALRRGEAGAE